MKRIRTVKDLIQALENIPLDTEVNILDDYCAPAEIGAVEYDEDLKLVTISY